MPDLKIRGYSATFEYSNVQKIWLDTPESTEDEPVLAPFTYGEVVEGVEIVPDFSAGDQVISVPEGSLVQEATILQPETLQPENIRENIEIAGIVGTYRPETEAVEVELAMAEGDQTVTPSDGKTLSKVTIKKPETLIPANIVKDVEIAGVVGTAEGGGNSGTDLTDEYFKYFTYQIDAENNLITLYSILYDVLYANTGSYDVNIPDKIGFFDVVIACS